MKKPKLKIPRRFAGIKIRKRQRRKLKAILRKVEGLEDMVSLGSAVVALVAARSSRDRDHSQDSGASFH